VVPTAVPRPDSGWTTDALIDACDETTRLISVSWIGYASGYRLDLEELIDRAHQRRILVFIDAIQGLGVYPIHVSALKADFLAADGHKWLLGPEGAGMLFIAERHLDLLRPLIAGWNSVELLQSAGAGPDSQRMADRIREVTSEARELLLSAGANFDRPRSSNHDSGILPFDIPGSDPASFRNRCLDGGVVLSVRGGRLRISPHVYNNREDLDRLTEIVRDQVRNPLSS
jgi:selenocysteine lyase/cysteine desulfurase